MGAECDPFVLESLKKEATAMPPKPQPVIDKRVDQKDKPMTELNKMKFKSKYDKYLVRVDKVKMQIKQAYSQYYGQVDDEMRSSLKDDDNFELAHNEKDVIALCKFIKMSISTTRKLKNPSRHFGRLRRTWSICTGIKWMSQNTITSSSLYQRWSIKCNTVVTAALSLK